MIRNIKKIGLIVGLGLFTAGSLAVILTGGGLWFKVIYQLSLSYIDNIFCIANKIITVTAIFIWLVYDLTKAYKNYKIYKVIRLSDNKKMQVWLHN